MATMTTALAELQQEYQIKFNKDLLKRAIQLTVLDQFATKMPFPKNMGAKSMRFFRQDAGGVEVSAGSGDYVSTISEGILLATLSEIGFSVVDATLVQYGQRYNISDVLGMTELFSTLNAVKSKIAEESALHADTIVRSILVPTSGGATKMYAGLEAGVPNATHAQLQNDTAAGGSLTISDVLRAMTLLQINRAPKKNGRYYIIVPPQVAYDLMLDPKFVNTGTYQDKTNIVKGEVGQWYGVAVVVATNPFRETTVEGQYQAAGGIFTSIVTGSDSFGTPLMAGESPYNPSIHIIDKPDKYDALNQWTVVAWKAYWATALLNPAWVIALRSKSTYA